jgi:DNA-binding protein YbaB
MFDLIETVTDRLADQATITPQSVISASPNHTVRVTSIGGTITSVEFDEHWLRTAGHDRIGDAIRDAAAAAARDTDHDREQRGHGDPSFDRLRQLTSSPQTLLREIGLIA